MVDLQKESPEVYYLSNPQKKLCVQDCKQLVNVAGKSQRNRARYCIHDSKESDIHEMFEVLTREVYMRPHKQKDKHTSYHLVAGALTAYLFDDNGQVIDRIILSEYYSGKDFYCHVPKNVYRMLVPDTDFVLYHETRKGPFDKADTVFAPWAPRESDAHGIAQFVSQLPMD